MSIPIIDLIPNPNGKMGMDLRDPETLQGRPCTVCICGSFTWLVLCSFEEEDSEISSYMLDMKCAVCGAVARAPHPDWERDGEKKDEYTYQD